MNDLFSRKAPAIKAPVIKAPAIKTGATRAGAAGAGLTGPVASGSAGKTAAAPVQAGYDARDIEVLEGLEPVRRRPGMYIGGTDETALHHLAAEILDNAMDEAVAGHASLIEFTLEADGRVTVRDNGRGIPVDRHPKFKDLSALEVIFTTLHSGGKFSGKAYETSGGLHGVGSSVVNALSSSLEVEVARDRAVWRQAYERGRPLGRLEKVGATQNRRGTQVRFLPDEQIFGSLQFNPKLLYRLCRSKAFLFRGVTLQWRCDAALLKGGSSDVPEEALLHFPGGLADSLRDELGEPARLLAELWSGDAALPAAPDGKPTGRLEWAIAWLESGEAAFASFCNTIPTPQGGTHETGFRNALLRGLRAWGEQRSNKRALQVTAEDLLGSVAAKLSVFIREPQFQGQTKEKLTNSEATRLVETALRDRFDHWLSGHPAQADNLLAFIIERAEERLRRREMKGHAAQIGDPAAAAARQAHRLHPRERRRGPRSSWSRATAPAARPSRRATARPRRCCRCAARSSTSPARRPRSCARNQELRDLVEALGCRRGREVRDGAAALRPGHHHDRRRCRRRAYRIPADDLLLPRAARADTRRAPLPGATAALPPYPGCQDDLRDGRSRPRAQAEVVVQTGREGRGQPLQGPRRDAAGRPEGRPRWTPHGAPCSRWWPPPRTVPRPAPLVESLMGRRPELRYQFIQEQRARSGTAGRVDARTLSS